MPDQSDSVFTTPRLVSHAGLSCFHSVVVTALAFRCCDTPTRKPGPFRTKEVVDTGSPMPECRECKPGAAQTAADQAQNAASQDPAMAQAASSMARKRRHSTIVNERVTKDWLCVRFQPHLHFLKRFATSDHLLVQSRFLEDSHDFVIEVHGARRVVDIGVGFATDNPPSTLSEQIGGNQPGRPHAIIRSSDQQ